MICRLFWVDHFKSQLLLLTSLTVLESLYWLKIDQPIYYKIISITYKTLQSRKPSYLHNLFRIQSDTRTRSSTLCSRLKITESSFPHHAPVLWNTLPKAFRLPGLHSSHIVQFGSILLRFLVYLHLNFTQSLKLIYSINHSLLSVFHALKSLLWLFDLASALSFHFHFRSIVHNLFIHLLYGLLMNTVIWFYFQR